MGRRNIAGYALLALHLSTLAHAHSSGSATTRRADDTDLTSLVDLFTGTVNAGNAFPGAAVPHGMAKVGIDVTSAPRQAGYVHNNATISGISLLHDEGTGGNSNGGYGVFPLFPLLGGAACTSPETSNCGVRLNQRAALRAAGTDEAQPGYFTTTFVNGIKLESTSTRRAGLIRLTFPSSSNSTTNYVVVDLTNDLQRSFQGGSLSITPTTDTDTLRVTLGGTFLQSYGTDNYTVYACYDFPQAQSTQTIYHSTYQASTSTSSNANITTNSTGVSFPFKTTNVEAGALLGFEGANSVLARFGVSFLSTERACENAAAEIPDMESPTEDGEQWDWAAVQSASQSQWESVLDRVSLPNGVGAENATVVELLYSSLYRAFLVPANLTDENPYWDNTEPFFDSLFCSWDTFRTVHPLLSLLDPVGWSGIVRSYVDGWRHEGYIPECRSNTKKGYVQGGSNGMPILGDFAAKYATHAADLGLSIKDLYSALVRTGEDTPPNWYMVGRQNTAWKTFGYIPTAWVDPSGSTGLPTREASRALEYALGDFAIRQAGNSILKNGLSSQLGSDVDLEADIEKYTNRSFNFRNHWDPSLQHGGFTGFSQRRAVNGTFLLSPPDACSPVDPVGHSCVRGDDNNVGFYESSSWEYSFFAPHSVSTLIDLMGGDETFIARVDHYFSTGYFYAGNEPGFGMPWIYHYANRPDLSALRVRDVVFRFFGTGFDGLPGNDDSGSMASLLVFHILGLYPVPASTQLLIGSPLLSSYTLTNSLLGTKTKFTVQNFDPTSLQTSPPSGSRVYVQSVSVNGVVQHSRCAIDFKDVVGGGEVVITVGSEIPADGCGSGAAGRPDSLETGGFA